jgi:hypothetical protein
MARRLVWRVLALLLGGSALLLLHRAREFILPKAGNRCVVNQVKAAKRPCAAYF